MMESQGLKKVVSINCITLHTPFALVKFETIFEVSCHLHLCMPSSNLMNHNVALLGKVPLSAIAHWQATLRW